jgi:hypothetical protein
MQAATRRFGAITAWITAGAERSGGRGCMWWEREMRVHADKSKSRTCTCNAFCVTICMRTHIRDRCTITNDAMRKEQVEVPFHTAQNGRLHEW